MCGAKAKRNVEGLVREAPGGGCAGQVVEGTQTVSVAESERAGGPDLQGLTLASSSDF